MWAAITRATNAGTPCCGSPTARLIGGLPGSMSLKSSRSRTKGERPTSARTGEGGETRSAAVMNIDKAAPAPAAPGMSYHRCGEVKARLTIGRVIPGDAEPKTVRGPSLRWDPSTARAVPGLRPNRISSVNDLAVQREIETLALHLIADAQPDEDVHDLEDDQRHDGVVDEDDDDALDLVDHLHRVAFDQAGRAAVLLDREHAGEQRAAGDRAGEKRADGAADGVHAEGVERIIVAQHVLQAGAAPVAEDAGGDADAQRAERADEARRRGNRHEAGNGAGADADDGRLAPHHPLD